MIKGDNHIFQGLKRGTHQIRQEDEFLWDARNIRITNREDSTLFSITNEKGTSEPLLSFEGCYVGHCVLGKYLVLFTSTEDTEFTCIYRIEEEDDSFKTIILFQGYINITPLNPIETLGYYETDLIQKVYWVDGINQPRVINIAKPELKLPKEYLVNGVNLQGPTYCTTDRDIDREIRTILGDDGLYNVNSFDFVRELSLNETVGVKKIYGYGEFSSGTVQYAFSYFNKYEQESNIFYTTPLYYASPKDRGGNPEEKVACSFEITVDNLDKNFEYIRIYSIHRTSIDAVPTVKLLEDIPISTKIVFIDTGTIGSTLEPTQLLYIGGNSLIANCMTQKDGTLFLGNIKQTEGEHFKEISNIILDGANSELDDWTINSGLVDKTDSSVYYDYTPDLSSEYSGAFKFGETYRLGLQVQYKNGKWSEPIYYNDIELNSGLPVWDTLPQKESKAIRILSKNTELKQILAKYGVKKIRSCVVFPRTYERDIICQGILCPTVYSVSGRKNNTIYSMSSWFFRPATKFINLNDSDIYKGASIQYKHNYSLLTGADRGAEIQNMLEGASTLGDITTSNVDKYNSHFFVDENIVTFHSPDIEFDTNIINSNYDEVSLRIIGIAKLGAIAGDIDIMTSTPVIDTFGSPGFIHNYIGYKTKSEKYINGGLISTLSYKDSSVIMEGDGKDYKPATVRHWMVYPWHRSGSLNNDSKRPTDKGTRSSVLLKKKISNLKFFNTNKSISPFINYKISTPKVFNSNEVSLLKLSPAYLNNDINYLGNIDNLITSGEPYPFYSGEQFDLKVVSGVGNTTYEYISESSDPVRMKYKSTPHLVFSLGNKSNEIQLLPRSAEIGNVQNENFSFPLWQQINNNKTYKGKYDHLVTFCTDTEYYSLDHPEKHKIGDCLIGKGQLKTDSGDYIDSYFFYIVASSSSGYSWKLLTSDYDGTIVKLNANYTKKAYGSAPPLGTKQSDWDSSNYIGTDRFFKLNIPKNNQEARSLEDVTDEVIKAPDSPSYALKQDVFGDSTTDWSYPYLLIGELVRNNVINKFGGKSKEALKQNLWIPAGRAVDINEDTNDDIIVPFEYGDTWYSRYDCLKTYPFTQEDENSVIEIGSFMCETRVNIDGRYDKNRGQISNINMTPQNFNKINEVYSQKDNFFPNTILDDDFYKQHVFNNQLVWSMQKHAGEGIDTWTNIVLSSSLDLDGSKGTITALETLNDYIFCFQERAFNQIMFNNREQIPVSDGVPIEISNGYKVSGSRIISEVGCKDKWSVIKTPSGIYFIDSDTDTIYLYSDKLYNLSDNNGMTWWLKNYHNRSLWSPLELSINSIRGFYDAIYGDIYFTPGPFLGEQLDALCYSEKVAKFTSFFSYGGTQAMFNFNDRFFSLKDDKGTLKLYENNVGKYNNFFGENKGWNLSFICNENPLNTKVFNNIELRTDHYSPNNEQTPLNTCPFNYIEVENEYQKGKEVVTGSNMKKKFRVWRGFIPRNEGTMQRIRNPWAMVTLGFDPKLSEDKNNKAIIHDVSVKYTV